MYRFFLISWHPIRGYLVIFVKAALISTKQKVAQRKVNHMTINVSKNSDKIFIFAPATDFKLHIPGKFG